MDKIDNKLINKKKLEEYQLLLTSINHVCQRIQKYKLYFSEFYTSSKKIDHLEALEYHIFSYLEDLTILQNKITVFLGVLKKDLKEIASNKEEIDSIFKISIKKIEKVFSEVSNSRNPHHHKGMKFIDAKLLEAQNAQSALKIWGEGGLLPKMNPIFIEELRIKEQKCFEEAKNNWIRLAESNNLHMMKLMDNVFLHAQNFIYKFLNINSVKKLLNI